MLTIGACLRFYISNLVPLHNTKSENVPGSEEGSKHLFAFACRPTRKAEPILTHSE